MTKKLKRRLAAVPPPAPPAPPAAGGAPTPSALAAGLAAASANPSGTQQGLSLENALNNLQSVARAHVANAEAHDAIRLSLVVVRDHINNTGLAIQETQRRLRALLDLPETNLDTLDKLLEALEDEFEDVDEVPLVAPVTAAPAPALAAPTAPAAPAPAAPAPANAAPATA